MEDVTTGALSEFKVSRWLAKNEDDGKVVRDLYTDDKIGFDSTDGGKSSSQYSKRHTGN